VMNAVNGHALAAGIGAAIVIWCFAAEVMAPK
jgi:hypothetical protein